jgi:hypothetical protein
MDLVTGANEQIRFRFQTQSGHPVLQAFQRQSRCPVETNMVQLA